MAELIQSTLLRRELLDERRYVESLLEAARRLGLIDEASPQDFQRRFLHFLAQKCQAYVGGRSRSMRAEMAESIGESILFTLGVHLMRFEPLDALAQLKNRPIEDCFHDGRTQVDSLLKSAELMHRMELHKSFIRENELLRDTLEGGISGFFKLYNPEYGAHEIHITADYPVLFYPQGFKGIEFIRRYAENIALENRFLRLFPVESARRLLSLYAIKNDTTLRELCDNLYEIQLACALQAFDSPEAMLDRLECSSPALREYVKRTCREYAADLERIRKIMR